MISVYRTVSSAHSERIENGEEEGGSLRPEAAIKEDFVQHIFIRFIRLVEQFFAQL
jgi:hypothetical protein